MAITAIAGSVDMTGVARYLNAWHFAENAGSPAICRILIRDGGLSGTVMVDIRIAASESKSQSYAKPLFFPSGIYIQQSAGTIRGGVDTA